MSRPFARSVLVVALGLWLAAFSRDRFDNWVDGTDLPQLAQSYSAEVLDRDGVLLRAYPVEDGRWRLRTSIDAVDPAYLEALIRYEDKRFYRHHGVDLLALARGVGQALLSGRVVSGGSTLTMQVARLLENSGTGHWQGKLRQIRLALALERRLSKEEILTLYLDLAPMGGNLEGVRSASLAYFGKSPRRLDPGEVALLVAIPQSPSLRRPDRYPESARAARDRVAERLAGAGLWSVRDRDLVLAEPVPDARRPFPALAPHMADRARADLPGQERVQLTLSADLQRAMESLAAQAVMGRSDRVQIAVMVADHQSGEILASVGSAGFDNEGQGGFIDLTQARRSPGSTLKPLIYGLAFDRGLLHPETLISDQPTDFGGYRPQNFDGLWHGDVRVRTALQLSLNIPAVAVTEAVGPQQLIAALNRVGVSPVIPGGEAGLAVVLGGLGVTLEDMVRVYAALGAAGQAVDLHWLPRETQATGQMFRRAAAWQVGDILQGVPRPLGVRAEGIAYKTGTSYGHRDAWSIGYDGRYVVGVWMGRPDGTPVPGAFGGDLAAPVMFAGFQRVEPAVTPLSPPPPETLIAANPDLPPPLQRLTRGGATHDPDAPEILFPPDGSVLDEDAPIALVRAGAPPFTWLLNGRPLGLSADPQLPLPEIGPGFSQLTVIDAEGRSAGAAFELRP